MNGPITQLLKSRRSVQEGFFAAGLTIAGVTALQSAAIVLSWIFSGVH